MNNVAIVGVEQSGKTALMISWGWHYFSPDCNGYYLSPDPNGGGVTRDFICEEMHRMKNGKWPDATSPDSVKKLNWILGRGGKSLGEMSFIDFGGEIYRKAFKDGPDATMALKKDPLKNKSYNDNTPESKAILQLQWHIRSCNALVILVDLACINNAGTEISQNNLSSGSTLLGEAEEKINRITALDENFDWRWLNERRSNISYWRDRLTFMQRLRNMKVPQNNLYPVMY